MSIMMLRSDAPLAGVAALSAYLPLAGDSPLVSSANAATPENQQPPSPVKEPSPVADESIPTADIPASNSPFAVLDSHAAQEQSAPALEVAVPPTPATDPPSHLTMAPLPPPTPISAVKATAPPSATGNAGGSLQLGAFVQQSNADRMQRAYASYGNVSVLQKQVANGMTMFIVRMGPFSTAEQTAQMLSKLRSAGVEARVVKE